MSSSHLLYSCLQIMQAQLWKCNSYRNFLLLNVCMRVCMRNSLPCAVKFSSLAISCKQWITRVDLALTHTHWDYLATDQQLHQQLHQWRSVVGCATTFQSDAASAHRRPVLVSNKLCSRRLWPTRLPSPACKNPNSQTFIDGRSSW